MVDVKKKEEEKRKNKVEKEGLIVLGEKYSTRNK